MVSKRKVYARKKAEKHLAYLVIVIVIIITIIFTISKTISLITLLFFIMALARYPRAWYAFWRLIRTIWRRGIKQQYSTYRRWTKGAKGEELVAEYLENLGDSYKIFNDLKFKNFDGNMDHLIIGKNGIFIIETKYFTGKVFCEKDTWTKEIRGELRYIKSPSIQVKKNAVKLKELIQRETSVKNLWVQGIVVISNENCHVEIKEPTVPILRPNQIKNFINNQKMNLTGKELNEIIKLIENHIEED